MEKRQFINLVFLLSIKLVIEKCTHTSHAGTWKSKDRPYHIGIANSKGIT